MSDRRRDEIDLTLLATYGRSGSSRMMELLRLTGARQVAGGFPYEVRSVQFGLLCRLGLGDVRADGAIVHNHFRYPSPAPRREGESDEAFRRRIVADCEDYRPYRDDRGIVEKAVGLALAAAIGAACPTVQFVFVDRDPRDVFLSVLSFNAARGYVSFGAEEGPMALAGRLAGYYREIAAFRAAHAGRTRTVSYADLVMRPLEAVAEACGGLPESARSLAPERLAEITTPSHMTSPSAGDSIDRWRADAELWPREMAVLAAAYAAFRGGLEA